MFGFSWTSIILFLGPLILPKALAYYRSVKKPYPHAPIRPPPPSAHRSLWILFIFSVIALLNTLPYFAPTEIFSLTDSRLELPTNLLFSRLANRNEPPSLDEAQTALRDHLNSKESRLLYFKYGPDVVAHCSFCDPEEPSNYFLYALPSILAPHLLHLGVLALSTSSLFAGPQARRWRTAATCAGIMMAVVELSITHNYDHKANTQLPRGAPIYRFFWKMRLFRSLAFAATTASLGYLIYLTSTNRAFVEIPPSAMRVESTIRRFEAVQNTLQAVTVARNVTLRDRKLKSLNDEYWLTESVVNDQMMEDPEVNQAMQNALKNLPITQIKADVNNYVEGMFGRPQDIES